MFTFPPQAIRINIFDYRSYLLFYLFIKRVSPPHSLLSTPFLILILRLFTTAYFNYIPHHTFVTPISPQDRKNTSKRDVSILFIYIIVLPYDLILCQENGHNE